METPSIGERFQVGQQKGTIRFVGLLPEINEKDYWVGVEWDDPARGKHSGTVKGGKRYFQTRHSDTGGSFLKLRKFSQKRRRGSLISDALETRYRKFDKDEELYVEDREGNIIEIEFVGLQEIHEKFSQWKNLEKISCCNMLVFETHSITQLSKHLEEVTEIDLSNNLLWKFQDILDLCSELPHLCSLIISENRFIYPTSKEMKNAPNKNIQTLVMNRCFPTLSSLLIISHCFPILTSLHLCSNNLSSLIFPSSSPPPFTTLESLNLMDNKFTSFRSQIFPFLSHLPSLSSLILSENFLTSISLSLSSLSSLTLLAISQNNIATPEPTLTSLSSLPKLRDLIIFGNPFYSFYSAPAFLPNHKTFSSLLGLSEKKKNSFSQEEEEQEMKNKHSRLRSAIISRVCTLETLNRSRIDDRDDHHKYFLSNVYEEKKEIIRTVVGNEGNNKKLKEVLGSRVWELLKEKRYEAYRSIYGLSTLEEGGVSLAEEERKVVVHKEKVDFVKLELRNIVVGKSKVKRLKGCMSVKQLRMMCCKLWRKVFKKGGYKDVELIWILDVEEKEDSEKEEKKVKLEKDEWTLGDYGLDCVEIGGTKKKKVDGVVLVSVRDVEKEKGEKEKEKNELKKRLEQQSKHISKQLYWQKKQYST